MTPRAGTARVLVAIALAVAAANVAHAQAPKAPPASSASPTPTSTPTPLAPPRGGALVHVVAEIVQALGAVPAGALVVASPLASDLPAPKGEELAVRIATQIAGRLGLSRAYEKTAPLAVARGHAGRAASLVYLQLEIAKGDLRVTADLYPVLSNGWERLRNPVPGPRAHAFAAAHLDPEVRSFLAPAVLEQAQLHKARHEEGDVLAVGCGDLDGDGGLDLVLVTRARIALGKLRGGKFVAQKVAPWASLASRVPVPLREPLATALVSPRAHFGELLVGTTDRGAVAVDASLVTKRQLTGLPIPGGDGDACAVPSLEAGVFDGNAIACAAPAKGEPAIAFVPPAARYDAIATLDAIGKDGSLSEIVATREPGGKLTVRRQDAGDAKPLELTLENVGAQIALVDLDLDGVPELVTTSDGDPEVLVVSSLTKANVVTRLRFPAKEGVRALAVCPPEERGVPAVVAVVGNEVWLVR